ncbi:MAG: M20/M25/M40 family metallo-hydrolase [Planctomycetota bacterium]|nr:M20/M25/M40 family metallo-hydrolase [Planctomycetota bacterium]
MHKLFTPWIALSLIAPLAHAQRAPEPLSDEVAERIAKEGIENSGVHAILREMTGDIGHRLTGSENFTKACAWAKAHFEKMGLDVQLEEWAEWTTIWSRGAWVGRIVEPVELDMYVATEAWTAGTKGPQTAGFVEAPRSSTDDAVVETKGKWVISRRKPTSRVRAAVEAAGALGVVYRAGDPNQNYPTRVRVFGDSRVARMPVEQAPKLPEIAVRSDDFDRLWSLFEEGKQPVAQFDIQNEFKPGPIQLNNVIATLRGTEKPDEWVVVSSHLDSWHQAQGCTDNGTGSATTMEAARILTTIGAKPKRSIKFCLWGGEEQGLLGSRGFVQRHRAMMNNVSACFNHDTGTNWAQSLTVTNQMKVQLEPIFAQVNRLLTAPDADWEGPVFSLRGTESIGGGRGGSDHASFLAAQVPGLGWGLKGRSDYFQHTWHTQWDTFDVAIEEYQRHTATVIAMAALGTANLDELLDRQNIRTRRSGRGQSSAFARAWFEGEMEGFTFKSVKKGGRAARMGVKAGDKLVQVGGKDVTSMRQIFQFAREVEGDSIKFGFQRGKDTFTAEMKKDEVSFGGRRRRNR